ncbi:MAG: hypothetical protein ABSH22_22080 [Tepidisphaeraceae bacterium]
MRVLRLSPQLSVTPVARVTHFLHKPSVLATMFNDVPQAYTWPQHPDDDHLFNLALHAKARYLVTWETRILNLGAATSQAGQLLKQLAPELSIMTAKQPAEFLKSQAPPP